MVKVELQDKVEEKPAEKPEEKPAEKQGSLIEEARVLAERLEKANAEQKVLIERQEKMLAEQRLGGSSFLSKEPEKKPEMTDLEYAKKVMAGEINPLDNKKL